MSNLEKQVAALVRLVTAEDSDSQKEAKAELLELMQERKAPAVSSNMEDTIRMVLLELGVPDHIKGHRCLLCAVSLAVKTPDVVNSMTKGLYPEVARSMNSTPCRVERAIRHGIEVAWERGDLDVFAAYFGNTISPSKGKPTNSEFISRLANVIRSRMKEAA